MAPLKSRNSHFILEKKTNKKKFIDIFFSRILTFASQLSSNKLSLNSNVDHFLFVMVVVVFGYLTFAFYFAYTFFNVKFFLWKSFYVCIWWPNSHHVYYHHHWERGNKKKDITSSYHQVFCVCLYVFDVFVWESVVLLLWFLMFFSFSFLSAVQMSFINYSLFFFFKFWSSVSLVVGYFNRFVMVV